MPSAPLSFSYHSVGRWALPARPPAPSATAGTPSAIGTLASVDAHASWCAWPTARVAATAVCTRGCPSGLTPRAHPLVQTAVAATRAVGHAHQLACASTDANVPIALGVPAVALGAGGRAGNAHLPTEWYENDKGALGIVRALLVTAAMAEAVA